MKLFTFTDGPDLTPNPPGLPASGRLAIRHPAKGLTRIVRTSPGAETEVVSPGPTDEVMRDYYRLRASERTAG